MLKITLLHTFWIGLGAWEWFDCACSRFFEFGITLVIFDNWLAFSSGCGSRPLVGLVYGHKYISATFDFFMEFYIFVVVVSSTIVTTAPFSTTP